MTQRKSRDRKIASVLIGAPSSGSGKTMVTCALLHILKKRGIRVSACKCGPDYIDPLFHEQALGVLSGNADTFFQTPGQIRELFAGRAEAEKTELFVTEGVMGLYDGLGGIRQEGSSYHLAEVLDCPIILVVDAKGMGRSVLSVIRGFLADDKQHLVKGIIFNRMSRGMYEVLKGSAEIEPEVRILGYVPEKKELSFESRYLGLTLPDQQQRLLEKLESFSRLLEECVDVDALCRLAGLYAAVLPKEPAGGMEEEKAGLSKPSGLRLAVAKDEAFCFYYRENLQLFTEMGAQIIYFSPLRDKGLPEKAAGLYIGGGYPEQFAEALSANTEMRSAIRRAVTEGMPILAECGGFMYLHEKLRDQQQRVYEMAGVIQGECFYTGRSVRFGYVEVQDESGNFIRGADAVKGHEFHYYDSSDNGSGCLIRKPFSGKSYRGVHVTKRAWMGFPHLFLPSNPGFAEDFLGKMRSYEAESGKGET